MGAEICQQAAQDNQDQITNEHDGNNVNSHKCCLPATQPSERLSNDQE